MLEENSFLFGSNPCLTRQTNRIMNFNHHFAAFIIAISFSFISQAQLLDLYTSLDSAEATMPLLKQENLLNEALSNKLKEYNRNYLPSLTANGQISYQSDAPELDVPIPGFTGLELPNVQYRASIDIAQPIFDAGISRALKISETAQSEASLKSLEVSKSAYKKQVALLYFQMLLVNDQISIISKSIDLMRERLKTVESAVENGVAQENDLLKLKSEILKLENKMDELTAAKMSGMEILGILTGINTTDRTLEKPEIQGSIDYSTSGNPTLQLLTTQQGSIMANESLLKAQRMPKVSAFGQVGLGAPNPFNFFEKDLSTYYIAGLRASWNIWDWGETSLKRKNLEINKQMVVEQQNQKKLEVESNLRTIKHQGDKYAKALERDEEILTMKSQIRKNASTQLDQGVITPAEYLDEVLAEQVAELNKSVNEISLYQNQIILQFETGTIK